MLINHFLFENVHSTKNVNEKRLRIDLASIKEMVQKGNVTLKWVDSRNQVADCFTKGGVNTQPLCEILSSGRILFDN